MTTPSSFRRASILLAAAALLAGIATGPGSQADAATPPTFVNYAATSSSGGSAGEPTLGVNWSTGNVLFQAGNRTLRVSGFDGSGGATWTNVTSLFTDFLSLDPMLFHDHRTGRTFVSQLLGACSRMAFTDDDGATWLPSPTGCGIGTVVDHQTVAGGPFASPLLGPLYADSVYYCTHALVVGTCAISIDGGLTFGPGVPIWRGTACSGGFGHLTVGPDGAAYVPHGACGGQQAALVSLDNGLTWGTRKIPDSTTQGESDPSIAVGPGGTIYFGYQGGDGHAYVTTSTDHGSTWTPSIDVGLNVGGDPSHDVKNAQFPAMIVGDDDRAALAFIGTQTAGNDQANDFAGVWNLYVSVTLDGGATWTTVEATTDPVQRGKICMGGLGCSGGRNLLDFMDVDIDAQGRIYVGYADGCRSCTVGAQSASAWATIARQSGGTDLIAGSAPAP